MGEEILPITSEDVRRALNHHVELLGKPEKDLGIVELRINAIHTLTVLLNALTSVDL